MTTDPCTGTSCEDGGELRPPDAARDAPSDAGHGRDAADASSGPDAGAWADAGYDSENIIYISDDFESGDLSQWFAWDREPGTMPRIAEDIGGRLGRVLHIPYRMPAGGPEHRDLGLYVHKDLSAQALEHFFIRGCFYSASTDSPTRARKLIYVKSDRWGEMDGDPKWDLIISLFGGIGAEPINITFGSNYSDYSDLSLPEWELATDKVDYDEWHCLEAELGLNTVGAHDGFARLWLDGSLEYEREGIAIRADDKPLGSVAFGYQLDRSGDTLPRSEDRYWDNLVVSSRANGSAL